MNKLAIILLIVVIGYVAYAAYPSLTGNVVSKIDPEKEDLEPSDPNDVGLSDVSEPQKVEGQKSISNIPENKTHAKNLCEKIVCQNSSKTCLDGFVSTCKNTCTEGVCSSCEPSCGGHDLILNENKTCTENWSCLDWSACLSGEQTRTCLDQNNCGTFLNKPNVSQNCSVQNQLTVLVSTDNQTLVRGNDVAINVKVEYDSNPVENANVVLNLTYASGTVVSNSSLTNSSGDYYWIKKISGNAKVGTFKIRVEATKQAYTTASAETSFEVVAKS